MLKEQREILLYIFCPKYLQQKGFKTKFFTFGKKNKKLEKKYVEFTEYMLK